MMGLIASATASPAASDLNRVLCSIAVSADVRDEIRDSMGGFLSSRHMKAARAPAKFAMVGSSLVACASIELATPSGVAVTMSGWGAALLSKVQT